MVDFAGWDMPVQYPTGILAEHQAVRTDCGLFDLSHMGRLWLRGRDALQLADTCCTRDLRRLRPGEAAYSVVCLPDGGIVDDVIAYVLQPDEVLLICNASNRETDHAWLSEQRDQLGLDVMMQDATFETTLIGVQGPRAQAVLQTSCSADLEPLPGYAFVQTTVAACAALVSRTGYTGEDGFELMVAAKDAERIWQRLLDGPGVVPCGLGARDTLRTEAAFALYGHEITPRTNPYEARLGWVVNLRKPSFIGRQALLDIRQRGVQRTLIGLQIEQGGVPRPGNTIVPGGQVTSGTFSPTLKKSIALGYVPVDQAQVGAQLGIELRGKAVPAEVVKLPFVAHRARPRATM